MDILLLPEEFSVCKLSSLRDIDFSADFLFLAKTDDELSLVCDAQRVPEGAIEVQPGFSAFKICGPLDFSLIGIIAGISATLAEAGISIFVSSTYDTDYILIPSAKREQAAARLKAAGHRLLESPPAHVAPG